MVKWMVSGKVWLEVAVEGLVTWYGTKCEGVWLRWWMAVGCGKLVVVVAVVEMDVRAV